MPPLQIGFVVLAWARVVLAFLGVFRLARELGMSERGALCSAAIYPLSGMYVSYLLYPMANALALVPWILWATERLAAGRRAGLALAAAVALQWLGGHPETSLHTALLVSLYLAVRGTGDSAVRVWGRYLSGWALGTALAAVQLVPLASAILRSSRWQHEAPGYSPTLLELSRLLLPRALGDATAGTWWGPRNDLGTASYVGLLALALALLGGSTLRADRRVRAVCVVTLLAFWLAFDQPLLRPILESLPIAGRALHHRLLFGVEIGLALLAGWGVELWLEGARRRALGAASVVLGLTAATVVGLWGRWAARGLLTAELRLAGLSLLPLVAFLLAWRLRPQWRLAVVPGLLALVVLDLLGAHLRVNPALPISRLFPRTGAIRFLEEHGGRVAGVGTALRPNAAMVYGLYDVRADDGLKSRRYEDLYSGHLAGSSAADFRPISHWRSRWLDRLGVRWVVAPPGAAPPVVAWRLAYDGADARVFERSGARPLVRWQGGKRAGIQVAARRPGGWRVTSESAASRTLVVAEIWDPGWRAQVDGRAVPVRTIDGVFLGIDLPAGRRETVLRFRPAGWLAGAALSGAALLTALATALRWRKPEHRAA